MANYPNITSLTDLDSSTPAGTEVASKIDEAIRQIKQFLGVYLAVAHNADGTVKAGAVPVAALADAIITYAKIQNVSNTDRLLGRSTAGAGVIEEIACTSFARTLLDDPDAATVLTTLGLGVVGTLATVGTANITALAITEALIAASAVTTAKIADANITTGKIADANVTVAKLSLPTGIDATPTVPVGATGGTVECTVGGVLRAVRVGSVLTFSMASTTVATSGADEAGLVYARVEETKAANTGAGGTSAAAWVDRTGWIENDPADIISISGANITFKKAGIYKIDVSVPCSGAVGFHRCKLYNVTSSADMKVGTTSQCAAGVTTRSEIHEIFEVSADNTVVKVQTWATNAVATTGMGAPSNQGDPEVYSILEIVKMN